MSQPFAAPSEPPPPPLDALLGRPPFINLLEGYTIYMSYDIETISERSTELCEALLETPQQPPRGTTLSRDPKSNAVRWMMHLWNEDQLTRNIGQAVVPSPEIIVKRGVKALSYLRGMVDQCWYHAVSFRDPEGELYETPEPWKTVGFRPSAFSPEQRAKIAAAENPSEDFAEPSYFATAENLFFPFLTAEVEAGDSDLVDAEHRNFVSQLTHLGGLLALFRSVGRQQELHRELTGFSVSFNAEQVWIWGYFLVIEGNRATVHRHPIGGFYLTSQVRPDERWSANTFVCNLYELWTPPHLRWICSAIDMFTTAQQPLQLRN